MADENLSFTEDLVENYSASSERLKTANSAEERKEELKTYDTLTGHVLARSEAEQRAFESDREFGHKCELDKLEYELRKLETEARIRDTEERRKIEVKRQKSEAARGWTQVGVTTGVTVLSTIAGFVFQYCMGKVNVSEGKLVGEDRVKFIDKIADKFDRNIKK